MEITVKCPELERLAAAIEKITPALLSVVNAAVYLSSEEVPCETGLVQAPPSYTPPVYQAPPVVPQMQPVPVYQATTPQPPIHAAPPPFVPVQAPPTYSPDQLAQAAIPLVDAGRREELTGLLGAFGVQAITQLPKERYGEFATALRGMGAKI